MKRDVKKCGLLKTQILEMLLLLGHISNHNQPSTGSSIIIWMPKPHKFLSIVRGWKRDISFSVSVRENLILPTYSTKVFGVTLNDHTKFHALITNICTTASRQINAFHSSPSGQNGRHFADDIFRCIFGNEKFSFFFIKISPKFVLKVPIDNNPALVYIIRRQAII